MAERSHTHVYSRSALTVWRAVPLCCNAMLAQRMRAQRASHTAARAEYHTLACPRSSARPSNHHIWSDIGLATQTTKTVVRGARGTCLQTTCEGRFQCVLGTTHRDRHHATGVVALARVSSPSRRNYEITASSEKSRPRLRLLRQSALQARRMLWSAASDGRAHELERRYLPGAGAYAPREAHRSQRALVAEPQS